MSDIQPKKLHIAAPLGAILGATIVVLAGVGAVYTLIRDAKKDHMELVAALSKNTQEVVLLKMIDEKAIKTHFLLPDLFDDQVLEDFVDEAIDEDGEE